MSDRVILKVKNISKAFPGTQALSNVSFDLRKGEVHALVGENGAGKSTMMNIISGVLTADSGEMLLYDKVIKQTTPKEAQEAGIGFVHQELATCTDLTVAENVFMGRLEEFKNKVGLVDYKKLRKRTSEYLELFNSKIDPALKVGILKVADQQIIEIVKSLSLDCKILILDEPTSSLTEAETVTLFNIINDLKSKGISILYISHRMEEIFEICDRVTILRDGHYIDTLNVGETTAEEIVKNMVGRTITNFYPNKSEKIKDAIIEADGLTISDMFENVSFKLNKGEILGFSGLVGAGRTELMRGLCGLYKLESGSVMLHGEKLNIKSYSDAIDNGIVYLTEDRKLQGLFLNLSVKKNISAATIKKVTNRLLISNKRETGFSNEYVQQLGIKVPDVEYKVNNLSGGNQQKVMIAKWLATGPKVFILDEPTRGIDVGAKLEIHNMLRDLANQGIGIIIVSSELPEILGMCDRVIVMHEGRVTGEVTGEEISEERIITLASSL